MCVQHAEDPRSARRHQCMPLRPLQSHPRSPALRYRGLGPRKRYLSPKALAAAQGLAVPVPLERQPPPQPSEEDRGRDDDVASWYSGIVWTRHSPTVLPRLHAGRFWCQCNPLAVTPKPNRQPCSRERGQTARVAPKGAIWGLQRRGAGPGKGAARGQNARARQLATTCWDCVLVAGTVA